MGENAEARGLEAQGGWKPGAVGVRELWRIEGWGLGGIPISHTTLDFRSEGRHR